MKRNFLTYILLCILLLGSAACQDDPLYNGGETGEGESLISATVKFKPLTPALNGNTRTAGNVIKNIEDLCVLLYNEKRRVAEDISPYQRNRRRAISIVGRQRQTG